MMAFGIGDVKPPGFVNRELDRHRLLLFCGI
jgi:hypothetical protein